MMSDRKRHVERGRDPQFRCPSDTRESAALTAQSTGPTSWGAPATSVRELEKADEDCL